MDPSARTSSRAWVETVNLFIWWSAVQLAEFTTSWQLSFFKHSVILCLCMCTCMWVHVWVWVCVSVGKMENCICHVVLSFYANTCSTVVMMPVYVCFSFYCVAHVYNRVSFVSKQCMIFDVCVNILQHCNNFELVWYETFILHVKLLYCMFTTCSLNLKMQCVLPCTVVWYMFCHKFIR